MSGPLRLGVIGCGRAARALHLPALRRVDGIEVGALADTDAGALRAAGDVCGGAARYAGHEALLADPTLDPGATQNLVVVATVEPAILPPLDRPQVSAEALGRPFTDAWAPVEYLQAKVFLQGLRWR